MHHWIDIEMRMKRMDIIRTFAKSCTLTGALALLSACSTMGNALNPFYEEPAPNALLGEANDHALGGSGGGAEDRARMAFDSMARYQAALPKDPADPVMQPAVVRVMWIPDHLNKNGDLVPAHYYYLKVLRDRWAVTDAYELEGQLHGDAKAGGANSSIPFVVDERR